MKFPACITSLYSGYQPVYEMWINDVLHTVHTLLISYPQGYTSRWLLLKANVTQLDNVLSKLL